MSRFKLFIAAVSITSLVMVTPWVISLYDEKSSQSSPINIALGASRGVLTAPVWIAEHEGYFSENGININIQEFNSGKASFAAMLAQDSLDLSTVAQTPITLSSFKRDDFAIIAAMVTSTKALKIVGRSDLGVTNVSDLKGKKVGLVKGSTGEFFLYLASK
jgi:ABC-type nitrate/sulfonate/bicarbonate transport system substrate-binding protein